MRIRICYDTDAPGLHAIVEAWSRKWRTVITVRSEERGCGCHHDLIELDAPEAAVAELPVEIFEAMP